MRFAGDDDAGLRGHAGLEQAVRIGHVDDHRVGHHALRIQGIQAELLHLALELARRESIDHKAHLLALAQQPHISLADIGLDHHFAQILGDQEQLGCLEAGRHGLPDVDATLDHDTVDRCTDHRVVQVGLDRVELGAGHVEAGNGDLGLAPALVALRRGDEALRQQRLAALEIAARKSQLRFRRCQLGLGLTHASLEIGRIQTQQDLAFLDPVVEVDHTLGHGAADRRADRHRRDRLQIAIGHHDLRDRAFIDGHRAKTRHFVLASVMPAPGPPAASAKDGQCQAKQGNLA